MPEIDLMFYLVHSPGWLQKLYPKRIWRINSDDAVYLTFDDGPHPEHTVFVLDELKKWNARATFFCIGSNVEKYPELYQRILDEGHATGNHTYDHLNGWKGDDEGYIKDVEKAADFIESNLFRPPYGRLNGFREKVLRESAAAYKIIMWTVLSGDFDKDITPRKCIDNVVLKTTPGSIVVFHDSEKASVNMRTALPALLEFLSNKKLKCEALTGL